MSYFSKVQIRDQYGFIGENTPMDEVRVAEACRLVGTNFSAPSGLTPTTGTTGTDPNFWTGTNTATAGGTQPTIAQTSGQVLISSGDKNDASSIFQTVRKARYVGSISNRFRAQVMLNNTGVASNTRRWGCFDGTDGAYFELAGTTLSACVIKAGARTAVSALTAPTTNVTSYEIYFTNAKVYFVIAGVLVATHTASTTTWADTLTLPCRIDNISTGSTTNCTISVRAATITRLGKLETNPQYKNITGVNTSQILKYGPGILHSITINTPVNNATVGIYDNVTGTGTPIAILTLPNSAVPFLVDFHCPFGTGLNIVPSSTTLDLTIIFE